jgi:acyl-CoA synthetase (AMP-forming)/AMP-acid ligase II
MPRTVAQAIEDAAKADPTRGFRFIPEGAPGLRGGGASGPPLPSGTPYGPPAGTENGASQTTFSFTAIERATARYGGALQALGLRRGDRVALILPQAEDFILCFLGAVRAGIVPVPIYPPLGLGQLQGYLDNTCHIVAKSGARALVTSSQIKRLLGTVQAASPALEQVVAVEGIRESLEPLKPEKISLDDIAFLQFTSGSTSRPKGVSVTHGNLATNIRCILDIGLKTNVDDVGVSWLPLYHDMGLIGFVLAPLTAAISVVFLPPLLFLKRPITWFQAVTRYKGTVSYAPNFAYALCVKRIREKDLEAIDLSSWRVAGCGAEPIRPETLEGFGTAFARVGFRKEALLPSYGMAESTLAVAFSAVGSGVRTLSIDGPRLWSEGVAASVDGEDERAVRIVACGSEFPEHSVRIFSPDDVRSDKPLAEDHVGEIRISGPSVMAGYWEDSERTREAFAGPFLCTGDLGFLHKREIYICGRSKEVIIVNGRNYYPQDMEWEASKVDGVRKGNVIAFGAKDPAGIERDRERVVLAFEMQDIDVPDRVYALSQAVRKAVQDGMGLTLDDVVPVGPGVLPKTSSGKLQRAKTRELYEENSLSLRVGKGDTSRLEIAKQTALSQLSYFRLAVLGGRKKKE